MKMIAQPNILLVLVSKVHTDSLKCEMVIKPHYANAAEGS